MRKCIMRKTAARGERESKRTEDLGKEARQSSVQHLTKQPGKEGGHCPGQAYKGRGGFMSSQSKG